MKNVKDQWADPSNTTVTHTPARLAGGQQKIDFNPPLPKRKWVSNTIKPMKLCPHNEGSILQESQGCENVM